MKHSYLSVLVLGLCFICSYLFLQPHIAGMLFSASRESQWNTFLEKTVAQKRIEPKEYWKLREFYNGGHFVFRLEGLGPQHTREFTHSGVIKINASFVERIFLRRYSERLNSIDGLAFSKNFANLYTEIDKKAYKTVFETSDSFILEEKKNTFVVFFVKDIAEMREANGYINYIDYREFLSDKFWVSFTRILVE
jgi:hypothetical protein